MDRLSLVVIKGIIKYTVQYYYNNEKKIFNFHSISFDNKTRHSIDLKHYQQYKKLNKEWIVSQAI